VCSSDLSEEYFIITRLHRDDIKSRGFKEEFTDEEMKYIASKMADDYLNQLYWGSLDIIVENVINQRENKKLYEEHQKKWEHKNE